MRKIVTFFKHLWHKPQAPPRIDFVDEHTQAKERGRSVFIEAMNFSTKFSSRLLREHPLKKSSVNEAVKHILMIGLVKAFFLHLAILRLSATEKQGKNVGFVTLFKQYLKDSFHAEFCQAREISEELALCTEEETPFQILKNKNLLSLYARCTLVSVNGERTAMDILAESLIHCFYKEGEHKMLSTYIYKRAEIEGIRFLSRV